MEETFKELATQAETETSHVRGSSVTSYGLQPVSYIKEIIDGAKNEMHFIHWIKEYTLPKGMHQLSIPKRTQYKGYHGITWNTAGSDTGGSGNGVGPYHNTQADISWEAVDTIDNVTATPLPVILGSTIRRFEMDTNAVGLLEVAREELSYAIADRIDNRLADAIGDATDATSTAAGAQCIYGGDANSDASGQLAAGDILTTDLIAKAAHYLKSNAFRYRASAGYGAESKASIASYRKNPWQNTKDDPFVLFIGPAQEEALRKDSQFVNASEYGDNTIIKNGEIGKIRYLGVRIVVTNNIEQVASGGTGAMSGSATGTDSTVCILMKAKKACALVWGKKPEIRVWDHNERDQVRIGLYCYYAITVVHDDAIVFLVVADA